MPDDRFPFRSSLLPAGEPDDKDSPQFLSILSVPFPCDFRYAAGQSAYQKAPRSAYSMISPEQIRFSRSRASPVDRGAHAIPREYLCSCFRHHSVIASGAPQGGGM